MTKKSKIKQAWTGKLVWDCPMADYTTLGVGGRADALIEPQSSEQLRALVCSLNQHNVPWQVLGRGSNVLVADQGIDWVVILLGKQFAKIANCQENYSTEGPIRIKAQAGCSLTHLINWCAKNDIGGLEFAAGIPGSIGGAIAMNAGAWGRDMGMIVDSVELLSATGDIFIQKTRPGDFSYRNWDRPQGSVITSATFLLEPLAQDLIQKKCKEIIAKRRRKQPRGKRNCGSFFKNPAGDAAGRLIEHASLKGAKVGKAMVSLEHANFLVNLGGATADDFFKLGLKVREEVMVKYGIKLEPEVKFLGRWPREFSCVSC